MTFIANNNNEVNFILMKFGPIWTNQPNPIFSKTIIFNIKVKVKLELNFLTDTQFEQIKFYKIYNLYYYI